MSQFSLLQLTALQGEH